MLVRTRMPAIIISLLRTIGVVLSIVIALCIPEWVARIFVPEWAPDEYVFFVPDRNSGWRHPPLTRLFYRDAIFTTNSLGLRDVEPAMDQRPRILLLGDSFTWGWGINNEERYSQLLQNKMPHTQIINAGLTGYGTLQELFLLESLYNVVRPDSVVLQIYDNDFEDNIESHAVHRRPYLDWQDNFRLINHPVENVSLHTRLFNYLAGETWFYRQLFQRLYGLIISLPISWHEHPPEAGEAEKQEGMKLSLKMFYAYCGEMRIPVTVFVHGLSVEREHIVREVSLQHGISVYMLDEAFVNASERVDLGDPHAHWNAYGNRRVAEFMYPLLARM